MIPQTATTILSNTSCISAFARLAGRSLTTSRHRKNIKPKKSLTLKDRLRQQIKQNSPIKDAELLSERLATRIEFFKQSFESFWKDSSLPRESPPKEMIVLDRNWWFWNTLLALSPAVLIALYCELVAKPKMQEMEEIGPQFQPIATWSDSMTHLTDWIQYKLLGTEFSDRKLRQHKLSTESSEIDKQIEQLRELQQLKQKLEALERQLSNESIPQSNIRQRIQERENRPAFPAKEHVHCEVAPKNTYLTSLLSSIEDSVQNILIPSNNPLQKEQEEPQCITPNANAQQMQLGLPPPSSTDIQEKRVVEKEENLAEESTLSNAKISKSNTGSPMKENTDAPTTSSDDAKTEKKEEKSGFGIARVWKRWTKG